MFKSHPVFVEPEPESKVWRYMNFNKFCSLLDKESLFFSEPSALGDKYEGSYPKNKNQYKPRPLSKESFELIKDDWGITYEQFLKEYRKNQEIRNNTFNICCFHINEHESFALWKLYASLNYGIAIQTTFENLKKSFDTCKDKEIFCGKVDYRDYNENSSDTIDIRNLFAPFLSKRKCFEYENECRAVFWDLPYLSNYCEKKGIPCPNIPSERNKILEKTNGIYIPVDLNSLILNVYCSPNSPEWFVELVKSTIKKYGYEFNVIKSSIDDEPQF